MKKHKPSKALILALAYGLPFVFTLLILGLGHSLYLRKVEEMQIFMSTAEYFGECMLMPGGLLEWCSTYLTQYFYDPWIGAALLALLLAGMQALIVKAMAMPWRWAAASGVVNAMLTLAPLVLGYVIFTFKTPGHVFTPVLGIIAASALFLAYRASGSMVMRMAVLALTAVAGYPLLGFYALLALGLDIIHDATRHQWVGMVFAAVMGAVIPQMWFYATPTIVMRERVYTSMLPRFLAGEGELLAPYIVAFAALAVLAALTGRYKANPARAWRSVIASMAMMLAAYASVPMLSYDDDNFRLTLKLDRALQDGEWQRAVEAAEAFDGKPTRLNVLLSDIALLRTGRASERMFALPISDAPYVTTSAREHTAMRDAGARLLYYHFGRVNDAYRWCMESKVEYGQKAEYLKYMAKIALLNGESRLAKKYLEALALTRNYKGWAKHYMKIADDPELLNRDKELAAIEPLMRFGDHLGGDGGNMESYLLQVTNALRGGPPELVELSIICGMIQKDLAEIWPKIVLYSNTHDRLPRHMQEAAIMYSVLQGSEAFRQLKVDPATEAEFSRFIELVKTNQNVPQERNAEIFRPRYGHTYWYYYFFTNNLKTT